MVSVITETNIIMMQKHWGKISVAAVLVLFAGAIWYANTAADRANEGVETAAHIKGNPDGAVSLIEYSDFQCPSCKAAAPVVASVLEQHGDTIRFEYRHFPLLTIHPYALPAARAAEAAGQQGKFWEMHDMLFERQESWSASANPSALFAAYADEIGLDMATYRRHLDASVLEQYVRGHFEEARTQGFTGTPTFVLNGERMTFNTFEEFINEINAAVAAANGTAVPSDDAGTTTAADLGLEFSL